MCWCLSIIELKNARWNIEKRNSKRELNFNSESEENNYHFKRSIYFMTQRLRGRETADSPIGADFPLNCS